MLFHFANAQWMKLPNSLNLELKDIKVVNPNHIYAAGQNGMGANFPNGQGRMYQSLDGGMSWDTILADTTSYSWMENIRIINPDTIYVAGRSNHFYKTTNGGMDWNIIEYYETWGGQAQAMDFVDANVGFLGNYKGEIYKTLNGGETWTLVFNNGNSTWHPIYEIHCPTDSICFALVDYDSSYEPVRVLKTEDAGQTWITIPEDIPFVNNIRPNGLFCINKDTIIAVAEFLLRSVDGGYTWNEFELDSSLLNIDFGDVQFIDNVGYAVGEQETILKSVDSGESWTVEYHIAGSDETILGLHMLDSNSIIACSNKGNIYQKGWVLVSTEQALVHEEIKIFPNPFNGQVVIDFKENRKNGHVLLYNVNGQCLKNIRIFNQAKVRIDTNDIQAGSFIIQYMDDESGLLVSELIFCKKY